MKREHLILIALLTIATIVRIYTLGDAPLWYDEAGTQWMGALSFSNMLAATGGDTHPPLYLALIWLIEHLGFKIGRAHV